MSVKLRKKKLKDGFSYYLDIYRDGRRTYKYLKIKVSNKDTEIDVRTKNDLAITFFDLERQSKNDESKVFSIKDNHRLTEMLNNKCNTIVKETKDFNIVVEKLAIELEKSYSKSTVHMLLRKVKKYVREEYGFFIRDKKDNAIKQRGTYIIHQTGTNLYKIGATSDKETRYKNFNLYMGDWSEVVFISKDIERQLHKHFKDKRVRSNNEWFCLTASDIEYIKKSIFTS